MGHKIIQEQKHFFISVKLNETEDALLGSKLFHNKPKNVISLFSDNEYKWKQKDEFVFPLQTNSGRRQIVEVSFNVIKDYKITTLPINIECKGAYYVSCFKQNEKEKLELIHKNLRSFFQVPVVFFPTDVIFFDGKTVSVRTFMVPLDKLFLIKLQENGMEPESIDLLKNGTERFRESIELRKEIY